MAVVQNRFGESTPSREAYRAHSSPNSPILLRLVKSPPLEGPVRHIVHQTFWNKTSESSTKHSSRWYRASVSSTKHSNRLLLLVAQGTLWLASSQIASSMAVEAQLMAVVQKRFGIYPLVEGPTRQVHPKTTTFCPVLGFTPSGRPSRAHQSQNDFEQRSPAVKQGSKPAWNG